VLADEGVLLEPIPTAVKSLGFFSYFCAREKAVQCSELAKNNHNARHGER